MEIIRPMAKRTYKAYRGREGLVLSTWTSAPISHEIEQAAYQARLDRGELSYVDVSSDDPHEPNFRMTPRATPAVTVNKGSNE